MAKLTKAQRRVLGAIGARPDGRASSYVIGSPRSNVTHALFMGGLVTIEGPTNAFGEPSMGGFWCITDAGKALLSLEQGEKP